MKQPADDDAGSPPLRSFVAGGGSLHNHHVVQDQALIQRQTQYVFRLFPTNRPTRNHRLYRLSVTCPKCLFLVFSQSNCSFCLLKCFQPISARVVLTQLPLFTQDLDQFRATYDSRLFQGFTSSVLLIWSTVGFLLVNTSYPQLAFFQLIFGLAHFLR